MTGPFECTDDLHRLDRRIASAWAALNGARASCWHSPNADNCAIEEMCENTVNDLLEKLWAELTPAQRTQVDRRDVRVAAPA